MSKKRRIGFFLLFFVIATFLYTYDRQQPYSWSWTFMKQTSTVEVDSKVLIQLAKHIARAHRYSRSSKTRVELSEAHKLIYSVLVDLNEKKLNKSFGIYTDRENVISTKNAPIICPDIYKGMMFDYPYYYRGYDTDYSNCKGEPFHTLITVLVNAVDDIAAEDLQFVLNGLLVWYPNIDVIVGHKKGEIEAQIRKFPKVRGVMFTKKDTNGFIWRKLAIATRTKYVFLARHMIRFDNHTRFDRLLRFLVANVADVIGTSHRYMDGRWSRGCYATAMRNYTLKFVDGYDFSYRSCLYCDYASGPFATSRSNFLNVVDDALHDDSVFVDFFAQMVEQSKILMVCPDVMTVTVENELHQIGKPYWLPFVQKFTLNRLIFSNNADLMFSCEESKSKCQRFGGLALPICCIIELANILKFVSKTFEETNISLELASGNIFGAIKFYGILPYERDSDFAFDIRHHRTLSNMVDLFASKGYALTEDKSIDYKCVNTSSVDCGYFEVRTFNWKVQLYGVNYLGTDEAFRVGLSRRTKVLVDGTWINGQHSPAAYCRNFYGDDIYAHVEHWSALGYSSGWVESKTGAWLKCPKRGFHGCLNQFLPVGDLQFKDVWI